MLIAGHTDAGRSLTNTVRISAVSIPLRAITLSNQSAVDAAAAVSGAWRNHYRDITRRSRVARMRRESRDTSILE